MKVDSADRAVVMIIIFVNVLTKLIVRVQMEDVGYLALVNGLCECVCKNNYEIIPSHIDHQHDEHSRVVRIYYTTEVAQCPSDDYK